MEKPFKTLKGEQARKFVANWPTFAPLEDDGDDVVVYLYAYTAYEKTKIRQMIKSL